MAPHITRAELVAQMATHEAGLIMRASHTARHNRIGARALTAAVRIIGEYADVTRDEIMAHASPYDTIGADALHGAYYGIGAYIIGELQACIDMQRHGHYTQRARALAITAVVLGVDMSRHADCMEYVDTIALHGARRLPINVICQRLSA